MLTGAWRIREEGAALLMALPVLKGTIMEYGYKGRGTVVLSNGKRLALRGNSDDADQPVPRPGDSVRCQVFYPLEGGVVVTDWALE